MSRLNTILGIESQKRRHGRYLASLPWLHGRDSKRALVLQRRASLVSGGYSLQRGRNTGYDGRRCVCNALPQPRLSAGCPLRVQIPLCCRASERQVSHHIRCVSATCLHCVLRGLWRMGHLSSLAIHCTLGLAHHSEEWVLRDV